MGKKLNKKYLIEAFPYYSQRLDYSQSAVSLAAFVAARPRSRATQKPLVPVSYGGIEVVGSKEELYSGEVTERGEGGFGSTGIK